MRYFILVLMIVVLVCTAIVSANVTNLEAIRFSGKINQQYPLAMVLFGYEQPGKDLLFGYYYYTKNRTPIFLKGERNGKRIQLTEYLDNGKANALFDGEHNREKGSFIGTWVYGGKKLPFQLQLDVPAPDKNNLDIHIGLKEIPVKYRLKSLTSEGTLEISAVKSQPRFAFDLYSLAKPDHTGILAENLKLTASGILFYEADPKAKTLDENCVLFFIGFPGRIFVYQYGNPAYLDFGTDVSAEGVYGK